jgi:hydroxyacylglutathione hydrolase
MQKHMTTVVNDSDLRIDRLELGPWATNAYIITYLQTRDSILIDAPVEADTIIKNLEGKEPKRILITHSHMDHIGALPGLRSRLKVPVAAQAADANGLPHAPEILLNDGDIIPLGKLEIQVLHTPGHTAGSLCFRLGKYLMSGDTIFTGGPGHTGSPAAFQQIFKSIRDKILVLPDDTEIYPGHGSPTILKKEKAEIDIFSSRPHSSDLYGDVLWLSS